MSRRRSMDLDVALDEPIITLEERLWEDLYNGLRSVVGERSSAADGSALGLAEARAAKPEIRLVDFVREAFHVVEPAREFVPGWHIDAIAEHLEAVSAGQIKRLIINVPPRHMKSMLVCVFWQPWEWTWAPWTRWLYSSYAEKLAKRDNVRARRLLQSRWYREQWGHMFRLLGDQNEKLRFENTKTGLRLATSVGGATTGEGGDRVVWDDPLKASAAHSDDKREGVNEWWDEEMSTRLNDPKTSAIVGIMQRLHQRDLSGHLLEKGGWDHLCLPLEYERNRPVTVPSPIGFVDPRKEEGEILWPERFDAQTIQRWKTDLGSYAAAGQLQQRPSPEGGGIYKKHWWRFWVPQHTNLPPVVIRVGNEVHNAVVVTLPHNLEQHIHSWDLTFGGGDEADFVAGQAWARAGADAFLLDREHGQWEFPDQIKAIMRLAERTPAPLKLVEDKANGKAAVATLRQKVPGLVAVNPEGDKVTRAMATSPYVEAGNVYLPHPAIAPWVWDFIEEHADFPNGAHDDDVDAQSQALRRLLGRHKAELDPADWPVVKR